MKALARRLELLQMEGSGFNRAEITKALSEKYGVSERAVCYDFQRKSTWQPQLLETGSRKSILQRVLNRFEQIYRKAAFIHLQSSNDNARVGALKVMLDANRGLLEAVGMDNVELNPDEIILRWETLEEREVRENHVSG